MVKNILIFLILISSAFFFNTKLLPIRVIHLIQVAAIGIMVVIIIAHNIYGRSETIKHNFKYPVFLIFTGVFLSMIIAQAYHNQNYGLTFWAQRFMYFYILYFFLHVLKPEIKDLEKILLTLGILYAVSYLLQYAIYPLAIFDVRLDADRGTIRIFMPGAAFFALSLFICLQRFYLENKLRYIFLALLFVTIVILMGTRNFMAAIAVTIIFSLLFSKTIKSRYVIYFIILISFIPVFILFQEIFAGLIDLSTKETANIHSDIRVRAAKFFLTDFFPNKLAYFFGNGHEHGQSMYGVRVATYMKYRSFYQSDVGLIGEFSKYGLFFVIGALWLLFRGFTSRLKPEQTYIKYHFLRVALVLPFGSNFTEPSSIAVLCTLIYIIDKNNYDLTEESTDPEISPPVISPGQ